MKKNKKLLSIISAIVVLVLLLGAYKLFIAPKGEKGSKEVIIKVMAEEQDINETFTYETNHEFLTALLEEKKDELGASLESSNYGTMVMGMGGYTADSGNNEFFLIQINGEDATTGTDEIALTDGDTYSFILDTY